HVFYFAKSLEARVAPFAADARFLDAAEWLPQIAHVLAVDEHHPGLNASREPVRLADVLRPHVRSQAVLDLVGELESLVFIREGYEARDGAEDFLLRHAHAIVDIGEHGRTQEITVLHPRSKVLWRRSSGGHCGACLASQLDVAGDLLPMRASDHRAQLGVVLARVADLEPVGSFGELAREVVVDAALHENARARGAALAVERKDGEQRCVE